MTTPVKHNTSDLQQAFCTNIMMEKYAIGDEKTPLEIYQRVSKGLAINDPEMEQKFLFSLNNGFTPGGRINRAIGADNITTAINCFVQPVGDAMSGPDKNGYVGIMDALRQSAETMRRGGGVGYDFSRIRPMGAKVNGTNSRASGPVSYMRVFDRMCETVESAGARRGAQMGVLRVDHPDIELFIDAKQATQFEKMGLNKEDADHLVGLMSSNAGFGWNLRKGIATLSNFNISVAATDEFMNAVVNDLDFDLVHQEPPAQGEVESKICADGVSRYIYRTVKAKGIWSKIMRNTYDAAEPGVIFIDTVNKSNNLNYCEKIEASNPCAEQFLPPYGACDLGSINLSRFVVNPFTPKAEFKTQEFLKVVQISVEFLDRVLDVTRWPLPEQQKESSNKRRIGLGYYGLADACAMLGIRYDSQQCIDFAKTITTALRDSAYAASIDLAKKLGSFPLFDADQYLATGTFASTLPEHIQLDIRQFGIRNSHLMSIAPTGTISMAFGNNASSGIEPIFSLRQERTKIMLDGTRQNFILDNNAYRVFQSIHGKDADPAVFATAMNMSVNDHLAVLEVVAPLVDSAISKTINVPEDYSFADFEHVYMRAWKAGVKGITTYRPNSMIGAVLKDATKKEKKVPIIEPSHGDSLRSEIKQDDPDRRIELKEVSAITTELRWPNRPNVPQGVPSVTYRLKHPGGDFALVVSHFVNGKNHPLECYVAGNEQPRGLAAIAKVLSVDMRTDDPAWMRMKIDSLLNTQADDSFSMPDPKSGEIIVAPSLVSGFAKLIEHSLDSMGALNVEGESNMVNALFSKREPKTTAQGSLAWAVDIRNDVTGDDFLMMTKELRLPDGSVRPYSVWLSGKYPKVLDGLSKILSIDMRVSDTSWVIMKLRKLLNFGEQRGDFLASVPGHTRQKNYPSTVAYMAALLLDRYRVLGLIAQPIKNESKAISAPSDAAQAPKKNGVATGTICPHCHTMSVHLIDGCKYCANCGEGGNCG